MTKTPPQPKDPRLDRLVHFDERSRDFPVTTLLAEDQEVVSNTWACNVNLDQGTEGACVGFGFSHELAAEPVIVPVSGPYARQLYFDAQRVDQWPGGAYPGATPHYEGSSVLAGAKVCKARGLITEYRWAFTLRDLMLSVSHVGPAVIGVSWYQGMIKPDSLHFLKPTGRLMGGHCVCITGISVAKKAFRVHNSWGLGWGVRGQAWLSWDSMALLMRRKGEVCIPVRRQAPPT
jgi:hypothetical protein